MTTAKVGALGVTVVGAGAVMVFGLFAAYVIGTTSLAAWLVWSWFLAEPVGLELSWSAWVGVTLLCRTLFAKLPADTDYEDEKAKWSVVVMLIYPWVIIAIGWVLS